MKIGGHETTGALGTAVTPALDRREIVQNAITASAAALARATAPAQTINYILSLMGEACAVSRIALYETGPPDNGRIDLLPRHEWTVTGAESEPGGSGPIRLDMKAARASGFLASFLKGDVCPLSTRNAEPPFRALLQAHGVVSALFIPVFVDDKRWGYCEIDDCQAEQVWSEREINAFEVMTSFVAAALLRERGMAELTDAARIIANSATVLFRFSASMPYTLSYFSNNISRYGYDAADMLGRPLLDIDIVHPEDLQDILHDISGLAAGTLTESGREVRLRTADGDYTWFECRIAPVRDSNNRVTEIEGLAIDIDRRKSTESYIARFTLTDQLTGLGNRAAFMEKVRQAFVAAKRGANPFAVLLIDLDHFKDINDVLGHSKGDALIKMVALRLQSTLRAGDIIARFGGDEFAILQAKLTDPSDAGALATRILRDIASPSYDLGTQVDISASIGISFFDADASDAEEVLKQADIALHRAKDAGRSQYHFHSEALDVEIIERVTLTGDLRRGIERGEFELYYQPQVEAATGRITGLEALARWRHPKHGLLMPSHFIPIAEKTGAILALGRWVIEEVCRQINDWRAHSLRPPPVSLNVSAVQMKSLPDFDSDLMRALDEARLEASAIEIELTESVLMSTTREHTDIIDRLNAMGVPIAIDDFGTGYSSLGYLRAYRVSHIKIAQEFIRDLREGSGDVAIVRAAISLARELGIKVIAEGVENAYQLRQLMAAGCAYVQGFYFSEPVPAARMTDLLRQKVLSPAGQTHT